MRTVRRLLYRDIVSAVVFVAIAFLSLFFFIDFAESLNDISKRGFSLQGALMGALLLVPDHFYLVFPIAVLIGTILSLARLAQTSEFTILRTGGLGPGRALALLAKLGLVFAAITFVAGDLVAPLAARVSAALKASATGGRDLGRTGAWVRDLRQDADGGDRQVSVNVSRVASNGELEGIRIFEYDAEGRLRARVAAARGRIDDVAGERAWVLQRATITRWTPSSASSATPGVTTASAVDETHATLRWPTSLDPTVVAAAVLPTGSMSTLELWKYSTHLAEREQSAQRYTIQFWKKAVYPFACIVMMALALPFAYLSARAGSASWKVFGGIMLGISFLLLNHVAEHVGVLSDWTPWLTAAAPSLLFLFLSLAAFAWLVRYR